MAAPSEASSSERSEAPGPGAAARGATASAELSERSAASSAAPSAAAAPSAGQEPSQSRRSWASDGSPGVSSRTSILKSDSAPRPSLGPVSFGASEVFDVSHEALSTSVVLARPRGQDEGEREERESEEDEHEEDGSSGPGSAEGGFVPDRSSSLELDSDSEGDVTESDADETQPFLGNLRRVGAAQLEGAWRGVLGSWRRGALLAALAAGLVAIVAARQSVAGVLAMLAAGARSAGARLQGAAAAAHIEAPCTGGARWGDWSACSATCGSGGAATRRDACGGDVERRPCEAELAVCPEAACEVGDWHAWRGCEDGGACGHGVSASRYRDVRAPPGLHGKRCPRLVERALCIAPQPCDAECGPRLGAWGDWGSCLATCDIGRRWRRRAALAGDAVAERCAEIGAEPEYCVAEGGRLCSVPRGAAESSGQEGGGSATDGDGADDGEEDGGLAADGARGRFRERVGQRLQLVGLREARVFHHLDLRGDADREDLLAALGAESAGARLRLRLGGRRVPSTWRLCGGGALRGRTAAARAEELRQLDGFPVRVRFASSSGNATALRVCFRQWFAASAVGVPALWVGASLRAIVRDPNGGSAVNLDMAVGCISEGGLADEDFFATATAAAAEEERRPVALQPAPVCQAVQKRLGDLARDPGAQGMRASLREADCFRRAGFTAGGLAWTGPPQLLRGGPESSAG